MNVVVLIHNQFNSGVFFKVLELCTAHKNNGLNISLICTSDRNHFKPKVKEINGIPIFCSPDLWWGKFRQGIDIWNIIVRIFYLIGQRIDVIHSIDSRPVVILPSLLIKILKKKPLLLSWWDRFGRGGTVLERSGKFYARSLGMIETLFEEKFRKYADYSSVVSTTLYKELIKLGYDSRKISIIRVGSFYKIKSNFTKTELRRQLDLPDKEIILIYIGSIFKNDLLFLLNSLDLLKQKTNVLPRTIMIGNYSINSTVCRELNIQIISRIQDEETFGKFLSASDFGLVPFLMSLSNMARWPSKTSDYLSYGLPIITTPISDYSIIFRKHKIGFLSKDDKIENYTEQLINALNTSDIELFEIKRKITAYFLEELDWDKISGRFINHYEELL